MEALQLPQREIRRRFTKSDIAILGWRGSEMNYNMRSNVRRAPSPHESFRGEKTITFDVEETVRQAYGIDEFDDRLLQIEERLGDVATKMVDEKGRIDLRKLTGPEACRFMGAMGMNFPTMG